MKVLKIIGYLFLILMGIVLIFASYFGVKEYIERRKQDRNLGLITIAVSYDLDTCSKDNPLLTRVSNGSDKILNYTKWYLLAKKLGYSNNVLENEYLSYENDKILKPNESHSICYKIPKIKRGSPYKLDYSKFSDEDLVALENEDYQSMSTEGLILVDDAENGFSPPVRDLIWEASLSDARFEEQ